MVVIDNWTLRQSTIRRCSNRQLDGMDLTCLTEVKAAASINPKDFHGLNKLKEIAGTNFKLGILLYDGDHTSSFGDKLFAVPIASLWS